MKKILISCLTAILLVVSCSFTVFAEEPVVYKKVTVSGVNVRSGAGTNFSIIGHLSGGDTVGVLHTNQGWSTVQYKNGVGFVYDQYLGNPDAPPARPVSHTMYVSARTTNVRAGGSLEYAVIGHLDYGTAVEVLEEGSNETWTEIHFYGGVGFISNSNLSATQPGVVPVTTMAPGPAIPAQTGKMTVTQGANVRTGPGINNPPLGQVTGGTVVDVIETMNGWCKIYYNGGIGYISQSLLK